MLYCARKHLQSTPFKQKTAAAGSSLGKTLQEDAVSRVIGRVDALLRNRTTVRAALLAAALGLVLPALTAQTRNDATYAAPAASKQSVKPSNAQLASPALEKRVDALLKQMTLDEKLGQLVQYGDTNDSANAVLASDAQAPGKNPDTHIKIDPMQLASTGRLGTMLNVVGAARTNAFQRAAVEKSRLHIPLIFGADILHGYRTVYPIPLGLAATFDPSMVEKVSHLSASESVTAGVRWFYSPMVDISRDPRWGRTQEGAGEDAYLGSAMAAAYIRGYQGKDLANPESVAASVKHFAAYGAAEAGREYNSTDISLSRLQQDYLPPYKAAAEAGAATFMSAFNSLNGVPATANRFLLQNMLRDAWGFNGFVVSDYTAVMELRNHGIALDAATAVRKALTAGVDVDMMSHYYDKELPQLIASGKVPMSVVDEAVRRVLRVKIALGLFEHPYADETREVTSPVEAHRALVREAAEESFVLLQNKPVNGAALLPLAKNASTIALIGPLADNSGEMLGNWGGNEHVPGVSTLKSALTARTQAAGGSLLYVKGTEVITASEDGFASAVEAAGKSDLVILALGESSEMSGEAGSRSDLGLPGNQEKLLEAVAAAGKPTIVVVFSGRPLILNWAAEHTAAIVEAWFPGTEAGNALANVLYGDVAPSGKLPMSFPRAVGQEPLYYNELPTGRPPVGIDLTKPNTGDARFISRYIDVPNDALFPFGYGLSYTTFEYSGVAVSRAKLPLAEAEHGSGKALVTATATVKNTGARAATEVVECYVRNLGASLSQPDRSLKGFARVTLQPGEAKQVSFPLGFAELSFYNNAGEAVIEPTDYTVWIGGSSLADQHAGFVIVE